MEIDADDRPDFDSYIDSFVAFIDVLGFSDLVRNIGGRSDFDDVSWLLFSMKKEAEAYSDASGMLDCLNAIAVSDSMIFTIPFAATEAALIFIPMLHYLQYNFIATQQTLLRGYIARGPVYHRDGILFGEGYMDAYNGETSLKGPPRIVVDSRIIQDARTAIEAQESLEGTVSIFSYLTEDEEDGQFFIDYLNPVGATAENPEIDLAAERLAIHEFVQKRFDDFEHTEGVRAKYEWLLAYLDSQGDSNAGESP